jgi:hypothetical protein
VGRRMLEAVAREVEAKVEVEQGRTLEVRG